MCSREKRTERNRLKKKTGKIARSKGSFRVPVCEFQQLGGYNCELSEVIQIDFKCKKDAGLTETQFQSKRKKTQG